MRSDLWDRRLMFWIRGKSSARHLLSSCFFLRVDVPRLWLHRLEFDLAEGNGEGFLPNGFAEWAPLHSPIRRQFVFCRVPRHQHRFSFRFLESVAQLKIGSNEKLFSLR